MGMTTAQPRDKGGRFVKLAEQKPKRPQTGELAGVKSQVGSGVSNFETYDPSKLRGPKGLEFFRKMVDTEPHIKAALQQKVEALLALRWDIEPATADPKHVEQAAFMRWMLADYIRGQFENDVREMLDALVTGFSVQEKVFSVVERGRWKDKIALKTLKSKDPENFTFDLDEFDNIKDDGVLFSASGQAQRLPRDKFVIFSYNSRYENPYGKSDLRAAYRAYWIKETAWRLRAVYMERFAGNFLKLKYNKGDATAETKAKQVLKNIMQETGFAIPSNMDLEVLQMAVASETEYARAIEASNKEILIGVLGVTLTVDEGDKTGARAMGQVHKQVADLFVQALAHRVQAAIKEQIVKPMIDLNFPDADEYPRFLFESMIPLTTADIKNLKDAGIPISNDWVLKKLRIPMAIGDSDVSAPVYAYHITSGVVTRNEVRRKLGLTEINEPFFKDKIDPATLGGGSPLSAAFSEALGRVAQGLPLLGPDWSALTEIKIVTLAEAAPHVVRLAEPAAPATPSPEPKPEGRYFRELNRFEKFAEIEKVDRRLLALESAAIAGSRAAYEKVRDEVLKWAQRKNLLGLSDDPKAQADALLLVPTVPVNTAPLKAQFEKTILTASLAGMADFVTSAQNQGFDFGSVRKFSEIVFDQEVLSEPITADEAAAYFSGKVPMTKAEFDALTHLSNSKAFYIAGLEKDVIAKDIKPLLEEAIRTGMTERDFKYRLEQLFAKYVTPVYGREGEKGQSVLDYHAETVFRNAMMSAYNAGKDSVRSKPAMVEAFPASLYSAILDNRTSDICRSLDGKVFKYNDPAWASYTPPNHHRCRSTLIAINKFDFTEDMLSGAPGVDLPVGFGGLS